MRSAQVVAVAPRARAREAVFKGRATAVEVGRKRPGVKVRRATAAPRALASVEVLVPALARTRVAAASGPGRGRGKDRSKAVRGARARARGRALAAGGTAASQPGTPTVQLKGLRADRPT